MATLVRADPTGEFARAIRTALAVRDPALPRLGELEIEAEPAGDAGITTLVSGRPPEALLEACPDLTWVVVPFAGIPTETRTRLADRPHLRLANLHHNAAPTAETALALLLAAAKRIVPADRALRRGDWSIRYADDPSMIFSGKRALVLGLGAIGSRVARVLTALEVTVRGIVRDPARADHARLPSVELLPLSALDEALASADLLIVTLPETEVTRGLIDRDRLARLPEGAILVNVGRGPVIDEAALHHALTEGSLGAAGIDVWWQYPKEEEERTSTAPGTLPFAACENLVLSPHRAGHGRGIETLRAESLLDRLAEIAAGSATAIDLGRGY